MPTRHKKKQLAGCTLGLCGLSDTLGDMERRLAAILAADMVGFSRQMQDDEVRTPSNLRHIQSTIIDPEIAVWRGRIFKTTGDGFLVEFASPMDALEGAIAIQKAAAAHNENKDSGEQAVFRMGLNIGDIMLDGDDVFGDGVNIAAHLEPLASPGGILVADTVQDQLWNKTDAAFESLGPQNLKNMDAPIVAYLVRAEPVRPGLVSWHPRTCPPLRRTLRRSAGDLIRI